MKAIHLTVLAALACFATGCGARSNTLPEKSAQEQLLISTAADRALERMNLHSLEGKRVYIDSSYLDAYQDQYVLGKLRNAISFYGGRLVGPKEVADVIVEPRSGGLSINESVFLLGLPSIPVFFLGTGAETPELAVFKIVTQKGVAKLSVFGYEAATRRLLFSTGVSLGSTTARSYTFAFVGPFTFDDLPKPPPEMEGDTYSLHQQPPPKPVVEDGPPSQGAGATPPEEELQEQPFEPAQPEEKNHGNGAPPPVDEEERGGMVPPEQDVRPVREEFPEEEEGTRPSARAEPGYDRGPQPQQNAGTTQNSSRARRARKQAGAARTAATPLFFSAVVLIPDSRPSPDSAIRDRTARAASPDFLSEAVRVCRPGCVCC